LFLFSYYIKSGNPEHPSDKLYDAVLQIKLKNDIKKLPAQYKRTKDNYISIDSFSNELGHVKGTLDANLFGLITDLRILISKASESWIIISEIDLTSKDKNAQKTLAKLLTTKKIS
jgi:hypothetical protein